MSREEEIKARIKELQELPNADRVKTRNVFPTEATNLFSGLLKSQDELVSAESRKFAPKGKTASTFDEELGKAVVNFKLPVPVKKFALKAFLGYVALGVLSTVVSIGTLSAVLFTLIKVAQYAVSH